VRPLRHGLNLRIMGFGFRAPKNRVAGLDVAGTVAAVGAAVTRLAVGDVRGKTAITI